MSITEVFGGKLTAPVLFDILVLSQNGYSGGKVVFIDTEVSTEKLTFLLLFLF